MTLGIECMQIFLSAPQRWQAPKHTDEQIVEFGRQVGAARIGPTFAHATYLINLASAEPGVRQRSIDTLVAACGWADRVGLNGTVVHVGSSRGQSIEDAESQVTAALEQVLASDFSSALLLENSAGSGEMLGSRFEQIGRLIQRLGSDPRLAICLDTAHTFASGYDLREAAGIQRAVDEIDAWVGLDRLLLVHANDSKVGLGSAVDRHENIGQGQLGDAAFERMLDHAALANLPWVLEVPGYDDKGPDARNVEQLRRLARRG